MTVHAMKTWRWPERIAMGFSWLSGVIALTLVGILLGFLLVRGVGALGPGTLFGEAAWWPALWGQEPVFDGLWPALAGTLTLVLAASALAIPLGIAGGIHLAEYAGGWWRALIGGAVDLLAGVPSIIMGLFGFGLILFLRRFLFPDANTCLGLAAVCLAMLVLPYLIRTTETALLALPERYRLLGPSLGLSHAQSIWRVRLPAAARGILSGVILAVGRVAEDTAVILLAGAVANAGLPRSLGDKFEALPFTIYYLTANHQTEAELNRAFAAALLLLSLAGLLFGLAYLVRRRLVKRWEGAA